jgi:hypothetical protein
MYVMVATDKDDFVHSCSSCWVVWALGSVRMVA